MKFALRIKLSTYKLLIARGLTVEKMRKANFSRANFSGANFSRADFSGADFSRANFSWANFSRANFSWANFSWANFSGALLHVVGIGVQIKIGRYTATFVGRYLSIGCKQHTIKQWVRASNEEYSQHEDGLRYELTIKRTIKAVFAMKKAGRLPRGA
jgi:hypothetical protein